MNYVYNSKIKTLNTKKEINSKNLTLWFVEF